MDTNSRVLASIAAVAPAYICRVRSMIPRNTISPAKGNATPRRNAYITLRSANTWVSENIVKKNVRVLRSLRKGMAIKNAITPAPIPSGASLVQRFTLFSWEESKRSLTGRYIQMTTSISAKMKTELAGYARLTIVPAKMLGDDLRLWTRYNPAAHEKSRPATHIPTTEKINLVRSNRVCFVNVSPDALSEHFCSHRIHHLFSAVEFSSDH